MLIDLSQSFVLNYSPSNEFETKVLNFILDWFSNEKTVEIQSSGSTGLPKVFEVEKSKMLNSAHMTCEFLNLKEGNCALVCLPIEYISGKMMVVRSIYQKMKLKILDPSLSPLLDLNEQIDFCALTPLQVEYSIDKLYLIKNLIIGGSSISESLKNKIIEKLRNSNCKVFESYGMSETLSHIGLREIFPFRKEWFTVFKDVDISLDERNCLKIYAPDLNPDILQTNDLVELKNNKEFRFLGRLDHVINSGGAKIYPEELEVFVKKSISNEIVFLGLEDEKLGQKLVLVIEGENDDNQKRIINSLNFSKSFQRPKQIIFINEIPRTPNGKINRLELKKMIENEKFLFRN